MHFRIYNKISQIDENSWNDLITDDSPFCRHEFLAALEQSGSVSIETGWKPCHFSVSDESDRVIAVMPFYIKSHSYGEYVFDWAWANAYQHHGLEYYPKGLCAIPFTPINSKKLFIKSDCNYDKVSHFLVDNVLKAARKLQLSSIHCLFLSPQEQRVFRSFDFILRSGNQFHWKNQNYQSFDEFLSDLNSKKRKKIRQDRKKVINLSINMKIVSGDELTEFDWKFFYHCYLNTIYSHGAIDYLNLDFFMKIGSTMASNIVIVQAIEDKKIIACALFFKGTSTLYGRYWGTIKPTQGLHFETCYYQAIQYCIDHKLSNFQAGAQGEHKLARGLLPTKTISAHWINHLGFKNAIALHVNQEDRHTQSYIDLLEKHSPYKENSS